MLATDTLGRRSRTRRQPIGKNISLRPRDLLWFEKLHQHGPLPTSYLHAFSKHLGKDPARSLKRLAALHHEGNYLTRPKQQFDTLDARYNQLVYDVGPNGLRALKQMGQHHDAIPQAGGPWKHRCMIACITASIELTTYDTDIRYVPQHAILARADVRLKIPVSFQLPGHGTVKHDLIPDALFGLEYSDAGKKSYRFFLVEADRATEPVQATSLARKSHKRSVYQYRELIGKKQYKDHFGLSAGMLVLHVTSNPEHMRHMIEVVEQVAETKQNTYMLFQTVGTFGAFFKPPKPLPQLLRGPWHRAGHGPFFLDRA